MAGNAPAGAFDLPQLVGTSPSSSANKALIAIADQPENKAEGKDRGRERERLRRICFLQIESDDLAANREQRDHQHRADLDNAFAAHD